MRTAIIGAGTLGLTLAHDLSRAGDEVSVFESRSQPGGLATWHEYDDFIWDRFYHVILPGDANLLGLIDELGVSNELRWREASTGVLWNRQILSMGTHKEFLLFPALSLMSKARLGAGILYTSRVSDLDALESVSAAEWLQRVFGKRVYRDLWQWLLRSKYGPLAEHAPASLLAAAIKRGYSARSGEAGRERMGYLRGGLKTMFDAMMEHLCDRGVHMHFDARVTRIDENGAGGATVRTADRGKRRYDRVISTLPSALFRRIAPAVEGRGGRTTGTPEYLGVACGVLVLKRPLSRYYTTTLIQQEYPITGVIELTSFVDREDVNGHSVVYLPRYDTPDSEWFDKPEGEVLEAFLGALRPMWPDIDENIVHRYLHRERYVQAVWPPGSSPAREPFVSDGGTVWSIGAELALQDTLNNDSVVRLARSMIPALTVGRSTTQAPIRAAASA